MIRHFPKSIVIPFVFSLCACSSGGGGSDVGAGGAGQGLPPGNYTGTCTAAGETLSMDASTCYYITTAPASWDASQEACVAWGGTLATVGMAEIAPLIGLLRMNVWIGYNDKTTEGAFTWVNGESSAYTNWAFAEPNNNGDQDCTVMYMNSGEWDDSLCTDLHVGLCEGRFAQ